MSREDVEAVSGEFLTIPEASECMNMSVRHVRRLVAERRIAFHRLGRSVRIARADVLAYVMARMGHDSMAAALIYQHASQEASQAIAAHLDAQLAEATTEASDDDDGASGVPATAS